MSYWDLFNETFRNDEKATASRIFSLRAKGSQAKTFPRDPIDVQDLTNICVPVEP